MVIMYYVEKGIFVEHYVPGTRPVSLYLSEVFQTDHFEKSYRY